MAGSEPENRMIGFVLGSFRREIRPWLAAVNQHSLTHDWREELRTKFVLAHLAGVWSTVGGLTDELLRR
jgi:hypothetical protein